MGVGRYYIDIDELETHGYFTEEEFYQVLDLVIGMKCAEKLSILEGLTLNLVEIDPNEKNTITKLTLTENYLNELAAK